MNIIQTIKTAFQPNQQPLAMSSDQPTACVGDLVLTREQFIEFRTAFKAKAKAKQITAKDIVLYNVIRGKDPKRGFTPVTNPTKLANGMRAWHGYNEASRGVDYTFAEPRFMINGAMYTSSVKAQEYRESWGTMLNAQVCLHIQAILKEAK